MGLVEDIHATSRIAEARIICLPTVSRGRSIITIADNAAEELPFEVKRVYYLYDLPAGAQRGGHSHREEHRLIIAVAGCFDVTIDDGVETATYTLRHPAQALYVPPGLWRTVHSFSAGAVALALCSTLYDASDYIRDYNEFKALTACKHTR